MEFAAASAFLAFELPRQLSSHDKHPRVRPDVILETLERVERMRFAISPKISGLAWPAPSLPVADIFKRAAMAAQYDDKMFHNGVLRSFDSQSQPVIENKR